VVFHLCLGKYLALWPNKNLPRILRKKSFITIYNYSKGAQGLSV